MIKLSKITKKYGKINAVDNLSLEIKNSEIVALLGPNGAGKSTTMKLISGYLMPDLGKVEIDGLDLKDNLIESQRKIGYMPENNPLYKEMLVRDAIQFSMELHGVKKSLWKERIDYVVKSTGIQNVYYRPISQLSKGYKQRVGLAQVLVHDPKILILDEPTEGLDPNQRLEIRNLIKSLGKERTVLISTHVMQEVEAMCTRVVIINRGKVVYDESIEKTTQALAKRKLTLEELFREVTKGVEEVTK